MTTPHTTKLELTPDELELVIKAMEEKSKELADYDRPDSSNLHKQIALKLERQAE